MVSGGNEGSRRDLIQPDEKLLSPEEEEGGMTSQALWGLPDNPLSRLFPPADVLSVAVISSCFTGDVCLFKV